MPGINLPTNDLMKKFAVNLPGAVEAIWQPLYDYQTYPTTGALSFTFFQDPVGSGGKTKSDTNMQASGQVPKGQTFVATAIQVELYLDNAEIYVAADQDRFLREYYKILSTKANLQLEIGSKPYLIQGPLAKFPPAQRVNGSVAVSTGTGVAATEGMSFGQGTGQTFQIIPLTLTSNQNFSVTVNFDALQTISTEARFGVTLQGYLFRNAQ